MNWHSVTSICKSILLAALVGVSSGCSLSNGAAPKPVGSQTKIESKQVSSTPENTVNEKTNVAIEKN